jgi:hypothetical protein
MKKLKHDIETKNTMMYNMIFIYGIDLQA